MSENVSTKKQKMNPDEEHCINKKAKFGNLSSDELSSSDESLLSDDMTGNDSSDYNERVKFGGTYMLQNSIRNKNVQRIENTKLFANSKFNFKSSQGRVFSDNYGFSMLKTSSQLIQKNENLQPSPGINSQISKIDMMFESFVRNSRLELQVLNNLIETPSNSGVQKQATASSMTNLFMEDTANSEINTFINVGLESDNEHEAKYSQSTIVNLPILVEYFPIEEGTNVENSSNTDAKAVNEVIDPNMVNANVSNVDEVDKSDLNAMNVSTVAVDTAEDANVQLADNVTFDAKPIQDSEQGIQLPMENFPGYEKNEILLYQEDVEAEKDANMPYAEGLVEILLPLPNETEAKYMNRAIELLFEPKFFVDTVCWQTADKRINIKTSYILGCWKKSFETNFGSDDNNSKFMGHFRRYKSAKRAADKAAEKKKNALAKKINFFV